MKTLSLFSGIGGFDLAFEKVFGPNHDIYFSEIDPYAIKVYKNHFPNSIELGDISKIDIKSLPKMDFIFGGSPCQDLSIAGKREGLGGARSGLFWKFVEIIKENKPKYFILENVNSMPKEAKQIITETLGVEPIMIDASLVSAQSRKRLFWTNIPNVILPEDRGILLKDILEEGIVDRDKSYCIDANYYKGANWKQYKEMGRRQLVVATLDEGTWAKRFEQIRRVYGIEGLSPTLPTGTGGGVIPKIHDVDNLVIRKLTPIECARLQCFPDNWCEGLSNTRQYKGYGNAVNVEVVKHIFEFTKKR